MKFYQIKQYGRLVKTHADKSMRTEQDTIRICNKIVAKAKKAVKEGTMLKGAFDVVVCESSGEEIDKFVCGTSYQY